MEKFCLDKDERGGSVNQMLYIKWKIGLQLANNGDVIGNQNIFLREVIDLQGPDLILFKTEVILYGSN